MRKREKKEDVDEKEILWMDVWMNEWMVGEVKKEEKKADEKIFFML